MFQSHLLMQRKLIYSCFFEYYVTHNVTFISPLNNILQLLKMQITANNLHEKQKKNLIQKKELHKIFRPYIEIYLNTYYLDTYLAIYTPDLCRQYTIEPSIGLPKREQIEPCILISLPPIGRTGPALSLSSNRLGR